MNSTAKRQLAEMLIRRAAEQNSRYPQYRGRFDACVLVRLKRSMKTKAGFAFATGEYAIADPEIRRFNDVNGRERETVTVYSSSNKIMTSVPRKDVEWLEGEPTRIVNPYAEVTG